MVFGAFNLLDRAYDEPSSSSEDESSAVGRVPAIRITNVTFGPSHPTTHPLQQKLSDSDLYISIEVEDVDWVVEPEPGMEVAQIVVEHGPITKQFRLPFESGTYRIPAPADVDISVDTVTPPEPVLRASANFFSFTISAWVVGKNGAFIYSPIAKWESEVRLLDKENHFVEGFPPFTVYPARMVPRSRAPFYFERDTPVEDGDKKLEKLLIHFLPYGTLNPRFWDIPAMGIDLRLRWWTHRQGRRTTTTYQSGDWAPLEWDPQKMMWTLEISPWSDPRDQYLWAEIVLMSTNSLTFADHFEPYTMKIGTIPAEPGVKPGV